MTGRQAWAFAPFAAVSLVHLAALAVGAQWLSGPTKPLLMVALLAAFLVALPSRRGRVAVVGSVALLFSLAGDVLLSTPGDTGFVSGLGAFLLAHVAYLVLFLGPLRRRRLPRLGVLLVLWWVALLILLQPYLGTLLVPLAAYGLVLGFSTAASFGTSRTIACGAALFLFSDTVLAFKLFLPDFSLWQADFIIMHAYLLGQGLIVLGAVSLARRAAAATAAAAPTA